jgi:predicted nucleotidyltransferase
MNQKLVLNKEKIANFCERHHIRRLAIFGSALRGDFGPESDVRIIRLIR